MPTIIHESFGTIGATRPLHVHCYRDECDGRAKKQADGRYKCRVCTSQFTPSHFDVKFTSPKLRNGDWVLMDWDPGRGPSTCSGVWYYEQAKP